MKKTNASAYDVFSELCREAEEEMSPSVLEAVRQLGEATPFELSGELFPHIKDFSIMLGVSEVVGHLDLLEDEGQLIRSSDRPSRYTAT